MAAVRDDAVVQIGQGQDEEAAEKDPVAQAEPGKVKAQEAQEGQDGENQLGQGVAGRDLHPAAFAAAALEEPAKNRDQLGRAEDMPAGGAMAAPPEGRLAMGDAPGDAVEEGAEDRPQGESDARTVNQQSPALPDGQCSRPLIWTSCLRTSRRRCARWHSSRRRQTRSG